MEMSPTPIVANVAPVAEVYEPWKPEVGDYVRLARRYDCEVVHSKFSTLLAPVYGRVEVVDRGFDNPTTWVEAIDSTDPADVEEITDLALKQRGHYYYVSDALGSGRFHLIDEHYRAEELVLVPAVDAIAGIARLAEELATWTPAQRMLARVGLDVRNGYR